jgi:hypothetical protein
MLRQTKDLHDLAIGTTGQVVNEHLENYGLFRMLLIVRLVPAGQSRVPAGAARDPQTVGVVMQFSSQAMSPFSIRRYACRRR